MSGRICQENATISQTPLFSPLSGLPVSAPTVMASNSKAERVKEITSFIRSKDLTLNEFFIAFYSSQDPSISKQRGQCLTLRKGSQFAPEELIDLWLKHSPSKSRPYLEGVVVDRAGKIIIKETDRACQLDSLCVPTTKIEVDNLDEDFLLSKLEGVYRATLPYLWSLLNAVVTSLNRSEKRNDEPSTCKEARARFVAYLSLSQSTI